MAIYLTRKMLDPTSRKGVEPELGGAIRRWLRATIRRWQRHKAIEALERLDDRLLADIGITCRSDIPRVVAELEAGAAEGATDRGGDAEGLETGRSAGGPNDDGARPSPRRIRAARHPRMPGRLPDRPGRPIRPDQFDRPDMTGAM